jgi:hypothetical protein
MASDPFAEFQQVTEETNVAVDNSTSSMLGAQDPTQAANDKRLALEVLTIIKVIVISNATYRASSNYSIEPCQ